MAVSHVLGSVVCDGRTSVLWKFSNAGFPHLTPIPCSTDVRFQPANLACYKDHLPSESEYKMAYYKYPAILRQWDHAEFDKTLRARNDRFMVWHLQTAKAAVEKSYTLLGNHCHHRIIINTLRHRGKIQWRLIVTDAAS
jgi:hypothetical protein